MLSVFSHKKEWNFSFEQKNIKSNKRPVSNKDVLGGKISEKLISVPGRLLGTLEYITFEY